jgi:hypothetical protein
MELCHLLLLIGHRMDLLLGFVHEKAHSEQKRVEVPENKTNTWMQQTNERIVTSKLISAMIKHTASCFVIEVNHATNKN